MTLEFSIKTPLYFALISLFLLSCDYIPKDDKHPEVPFFHDIIKDRNIFEKVIELGSESEKIHLLNNGKLLYISRSLKKAELEKPINVEEKTAINDNDKMIYTIEIRDFENKIYFKKEIESHAYAQDFVIIIDKEANLYLKGNQYFSPDYQNSKTLEEVNVMDSLYAYDPKVESGITQDSLKKEYKKALAKKYKIEWTEDATYFIQNNQIIIADNPEIINDAELTAKNFDTFDEAVLIEYRNDNRAFPSSYYYDYYKIGNLKFKYSDGTSGMEPPQKIENNGKTYLYHPKHGLYKILTK